MRIGVVGLGYWGAKHVRVLSALAGIDQVVGFDVDPQRCAEMGAAFPALRLAADLDDLMRTVEGVVIATKPSTHVPLAASALRRGAGVLVEKPLALSTSDAMFLRDVSLETGRTLMVGHTFAYNPAVQALRDLVRGGELGEVLHIHSQRLNLGHYQTDCDVLWDLAPHDISIINMLLGGPPTSVHSWGRGHINRSVADNAYLMLEYADTNTQAVVHVSWLDPHRVRRLTVVGSLRMVVFDDLADDERLRIFDKGVDFNEQAVAHEKPTSYRYGDIHSPYIPFEEPLRLEDQHFVDCLRTGAPPLTGAEAGLDVVRTLEAASISLTQGREVRVEEVEGGPRTVDLTEVAIR